MRVPLRAVAFLFLRLGTTAFGGPAAHLAMMHAEVVRRRQWLTDAEFADLLAAANLIPGPNSTEMAIYVGRKVAGWRGLLVAGICFILPAALIVALMARAYARYGRSVDARNVLSGVIPVVFAVVIQAVWRLSQSALRGPRAAVVAGGSLILSLLGVHELWLLAAGAGAMLALSSAGLIAAAMLTVAPAQAAGPSGAAMFSLTDLTLFFLKVGAVLFGSGYVLIAFLHGDLVERWHWLTDQQLLDAIAVGQITPGPVFTTATFIGYLLGGWRGAVLATTGIFLPAFVFVAITHPLIPKLRQSPTLATALDGVVAASLGLMAAVALRLGTTVLEDPVSIVLCALATVVLIVRPVNSMWLVIAGACAGVLRGWWS